MRHLAVLLAAFAGSGLPAAEPVKSAPIQVLDFNGRIEAQTVRIRPLVSGQLIKLNVAEGSSVKAGEILAEIDPRSSQTELARAEALLLKAQAKARHAGTMLQRAKALSERGAVSREEVSEAEAGVEVSQADIALAKVERERAALNLSRTKLIAPMDGRVGRFNATVGDLLTAEAETPLTVVVATDRLTVAFNVDERSLLRLRRAGLAGPGKMAAIVGLADEDGFPHAAELTSIDSALDPNTRAIRFHAALPNPDGLISPGMAARVRLTLPDKK